MIVMKLCGPFSFCTSLYIPHPSQEVSTPVNRVSAKPCSITLTVGDGVCSTIPNGQWIGSISYIISHEDVVKFCSLSGSSLGLFSPAYFDPGL